MDHCHLQPRICPVLTNLDSNNTHKDLSSFSCCHSQSFKQFVWYQPNYSPIQGSWNTRTKQLSVERGLLVWRLVSKYCVHLQKGQKNNIRETADQSTLFQSLGALWNASLQKVFPGTQMTRSWLWKANMDILKGKSCLTKHLAQWMRGNLRISSTLILARCLTQTPSKSILTSH